MFEFNIAAEVADSGRVLSDILEAVVVRTADD